MFTHLYGPKEYEKDGTRKPAHGSGTSATNVHGEPASADVDVACAICCIAFSSDRGRLSCGHKFCYKCIKKWQRSKASEGMVSKCPLCQKPFKMVDWWPFADLPVAEETKQKETGLSVRMILDDMVEVARNQPVASVCSICENREPEARLIFCDFCQRKAVHSCCLDAPVPWTCKGCMTSKRMYESCDNPPLSFRNRGGTWSGR